ncbi:MAG: DUF58 domain-containing protein [Candidatus Heimdallarchaeota archaeon]|nr:MAG: DUF58 domain-containing protein [Candidatus Heimdallarchaeota archaeon]
MIFVELTIRNEGVRIPTLEIVDLIPDECTVNEGSNHWLLELDQGEEVTFSYAIQCHKRGRYDLGPVVVRYSDVFYFHSEVSEYPVYTPITVVPSLIKLKNLPINRQRLLPEAGTIPSQIYKGRDFDFQGVRDYQAGDEVRVINWRVTAKFNKLASNEYSFDQPARIFVIFDHTASTIRLLEEGVMATLSTSEYLISQRNKVGFYAIGEFIHEIPAAPGKRQLLKINEYLIDCEGSSPHFEDTFRLRVNQRLIPSLPPFSQIFLISPLYDRIIVDFLKKLVKRGHSVSLILPRLDVNMKKRHFPSISSQIANSLTSLERILLLEKASQLGIIQIPWFPQGPKSAKIQLRRTR